MYYEWINLVNYYNLEGPTVMAQTKALGDTVFIHCTVVVCKTDETTETCSNVSDHAAGLFRPQS